MSGSFWQDYKLPIGLGGAALVALMLSMIVVPETEQAVVVRTGRPIAVYNPFVPKAEYGSTGAGVHFRIPIVDRVVRIDKRLLSVDMQPQQVLSTDQ
jgi:membrane protease subunit HflC